jgi:hypothetical protein
METQISISTIVAIMMFLFTLAHRLRKRWKQQQLFPHNLELVTGLQFRLQNAHLIMAVACLNVPQTCLTEIFVKQIELFQMETLDTILTIAEVTTFSNILVTVFGLQRRYRWRRHNLEVVIGLPLLHQNAHLIMEGIYLNVQETCLKEIFVRLTELFQMEIRISTSTTAAVTMSSNIHVLLIPVTGHQFRLQNVHLMMDEVSANALQECMKESSVKRTELFQMETQISTSTTAATMTCSDILAMVKLLSL